MSNSQISTFNFKSIPVRIEIQNNEPFFCLLDVAEVLGLGNRSISKFKFNPKGVEKLSIPSKGGLQETVFINEPNLYRVIFRSNKPEAEQFQNWVFEEVLPQIRKTGKYQLEPKQIALPEPEKQYQHSFIEHELQRLAWLWFACYNNLELLEQMATPLQKLGSHFGTTAYTHAVEYKRVLRDSHNIIKRITQDFDVSTWGDENWNRVLPTIRNFNPKPTHYALTRR